MKHAVFIALFAAACGALPARKQGVARVERTAPGVVHPVLAPTPRPPTELEVVIPANVACRIGSAPGGYGYPLRLAVDAQPFAGVEPTRMRVHVPADPVARGLIAELDLGKVELTAIVQTSDLDLFSTRELLLGGMFSPSGKTELQLVGASDGEVRVGLRRSPMGIAELQLPLVADVGCEHLRFLPTPLDARAALGRRVGTSGLAGQAIALHLRPGGPPVATLDSGRRVVDVLQRMDTMSRVAWTDGGGFMSAWVSNSALEGIGSSPPQVRMAPLWHLWRSPPGLEQRLCARDLALGVTTDDAVGWIGKIRAGTPIEVDGASGVDVARLTNIHIDDLDLRLGDAELIVRTRDLRECALTRQDRRGLALR